MSPEVFEIVPLGSLVRDPDNPRRITDLQKRRLQQSVREFGMVDPIIARRSDKRIIGGHQRFEVAVELGLLTVPVIWWDGTDQQARALNLALNRIGGEWNKEKLGVVLADLAQVDGLSDALLGFDASWTTLAGFDAKEVLAALNTQLDEVHGEDLARLASQLLDREKASSRANLGDRFALGPHRLNCGDSRNRDEVEQLCSDNQPSLLVTDPPYNVAYAPDGQAAPSGRTNGRRRRPLGPILEDDLLPEDYQSLVSAALTNAASVLAPGSAVYVFGGTSSTSVYDIAFKEAGLVKSSIIIWDKGEFSLGRKDYHSQFEPIYYGWLRGAPHRFFGNRSQSDIWVVPRDATSTYIHATQKPATLAERAIRNSTQPGEAVLDLFGGSGSTLIAAEKAGRKAMLMELDPHYVDVIIARWEAFTGGHAELIGTSSNA